MKDKPDVMPAEPESEDQQTADKGTAIVVFVNVIIRTA